MQRKVENASQWKDKWIRICGNLHSVHGKLVDFSCGEFTKKDFYITSDEILKIMESNQPETRRTKSGMTVKIHPDECVLHCLFDGQLRGVCRRQVDFENKLE